MSKAVMRGLLAASLAMGLLADASAQNFPNRPVRIVVPYAPGGGTDIISRQLAQKLSEAWSQSVVVENRPGANGIVGTDVVLKSAPDGHHLVVVVGAHVINGSLQKSMPFDPVADVSAVTLLATSPWVVVVTPSVPANTLQEFIAHAKANPGKLRFGSSEPSSRLAGEQFKQQAGVDLTHVAYKGGSMIMTDMLGGHIEAGFTSTLTVLQHYKSGKLKVLAVAGRARHPSMPDVPTAIEGGLPAYETYAWYGMYTGKNVPAEIVAKIQQDIARIVKLPDMRDKLNQFGAEPVANSPQEFAAFTRAEFDKYAKLIRQAGIQAE